MSTPLFKTLAQLTSLCTFIVLIAACGSSKDKDPNEVTSGDPKPEVILPMAIQYPPAVTSTRDDSIVVRGSNTTNNSVTAITLNGNDITTPLSVDDKGQWLLALDLDDGENNLVISYENESGETQPALERTIFKHYTLASPRAIFEHDEQFLLVDEDFIISVDKTSGVRSIFLGPDNSANPIVFVQPTGLAVDEANNRLLVLDPSIRAVIAIDLDTKARSILIDCDNEFFSAKCDNEIPVDENDETILNYYTFGSPMSMTLDSSNSRILIVDRRGRVTLPAITNNDDGTTTTEYFYEEPINDTGIVSWSTIYGVTLSADPELDGQIEVVVDSSDNLDYKQIIPTDNAVYKADTNSLIVASTITIDYTRISQFVSYSPRCIYNIDLNTGERTIAWLAVQERDEENQVAYDIAGGDIVEINLKAPEAEDDEPLFKTRALHEISQAVTADDSISPYTELSEQNTLSFALNRPSSVKLDRTNNRLIIVDEYGFISREKDDGNSSTTEQTSAGLVFFSYDLSDREAGDVSPRMTILNQATIPSDDLNYQGLTFAGLSLNETGDTATFKGFQLNAETELLEFHEVAVNLNDGSATLVTDSAEVTARLNSPSYLQLLDDGETLIIGNSTPQYAVRTTLSNLSVHELITGPFDSDLPFKQISGIAYDEASSTIYLTDLEYKSILKYTEGDEDKSILDANPVNDSITEYAFNSPKDVITDNNGENLYVLDSSNNQVIGINLANGTRSLIVENPVSPFTIEGINEIVNAGLEPIYAPAGLTLGSHENELIILDKFRLNRGSSWGHVIPAVLSVDMIANQASYFVGQQLNDNRNKIYTEYYSRRRQYRIDIDGEIITDERNGRLLIPARSRTPTLLGTENRGIVITVDLASGAVDYLYLAPIDENIFDKLRRPVGGSIDYSNNQLVLVDREQDSLYGINLTSGSARIISSGLNGVDTLLRSPTAVSVDRLGEFAYVSDSAYNSLIKVDLTTGLREELDTTNSLNKIYQPRGMAMDHINQTIFVADNLLDVVVVVDPVTGQQAYLH